MSASRRPTLVIDTRDAARGPTSGERARPHTLTRSTWSANSACPAATSFHGALTLDQLWAARPMLGYADYRSPVRGLYLCGSGAHPGGGVTGLPGHNCAREMIRDRRRGWRAGETLKNCELCREAAQLDERGKAESRIAMPVYRESASGLLYSELL